MASSELILLAFLVFAAINQFTSAKGDDALINTVCDKTSEPKLCRQCFASNPSSPQKDMQSLGIISIQCASQQASQTQNLFSNYGSSSTDPAVKDAFSKCEVIFHNIGNILGDALKSLSQNLKQDSDLQVKAASGVQWKCIGLVKKLPRPSDLDSSLATFRGYATAADGVIQQIP